MKVTQHAIDRIKERFPKYHYWQIYGLAEEALKYGIRTGDYNRYILNDIIFIIYGGRKNNSEYPRLITCWEK